jgi:hypothetical protein
MLTPQQITDYKQKWMSNCPFIVELHSDYRSRAKDWCKRVLMKQQYVLKEYTAVYEDTWFFENQKDANDFTRCIKQFSKSFAESGVPGP